MQWKIITIGKPKLSYAQIAVEEYLPRFRTLIPIDLQHIRPRKSEGESEALLRHSDTAFRVVLNETGEQFTSLQFAERIAQWEHLPYKTICFLIGGASGHDEILLKKANAQWSLGYLTLQHELALVVLLEQLYRACCIRNGSPYHRE